MAPTITGNGTLATIAGNRTRASECDKEENERYSFVSSV